MTHPFATRRGREFRNRILLRDLWTCQMCSAILRTGRTDDRAAVVDHIRPIDLRPDLTWDEGNVRAVCAACHNGPCAAIERRHAGDAEKIAAAKLSWEKPLRFDAKGFPIW